MNKNTMATNIVEKAELREVQKETLEILYNAVLNSAGVFGSNTLINKEKIYPIYTKDGKRILENIKFAGPIQNGIVDELVQMVQYVVKEVGDGTTMTVLLSKAVFDNLLIHEANNTETPYEIIHQFQRAVELIKGEILSSGRECTLDDIYKICMVSTNGNEYISDIIAETYREYGLGVHINVEMTSDENIYKKGYNGVTISKGYVSPSYINSQNNMCVLNNASVYFFNDPINTEEMIGLFTRIIYDNIIIPIDEQKKCIPTLIMAPSISRDASALLDDLESIMHRFDNAITARPPLCIVTDLNQYIDDMKDIAMLCGAKVIGKYIDPEVQERAIEEGKAPIPDNVSTQFAGHAEMIEISGNSTVFANPYNMYEHDEQNPNVFKKDENGDFIYSGAYNALLSFLKNELQNLDDEPGEDVVSRKMLTRRIANISTEMVTLYIGGIAASDRESLKDSVDDAVLNCRSASNHGVGWGCGFSGLLATKKCLECETDSELKKFFEIILNAYTAVYKSICSTKYSLKNLESAFDLSICNGMPINLRTNKFDGLVLSSIKTDAVILEAISKVVTVMLSANQALVANPLNNPYRPDEEVSSLT